MGTMRMALAAVCLVGVSALGGTVATGPMPAPPAGTGPAPAPSPPVVLPPATHLVLLFPPTLDTPEGEWLTRPDGQPIWRVTIHQQCLVLHGEGEQCREYESPQRLYADLQPSGGNVWLLGQREATHAGGNGIAVARSPFTPTLFRGEKVTPGHLGPALSQRERAPLP